MKKRWIQSKFTSLTHLLTHSLPGHGSCIPKTQTKQLTTTILPRKNKLTIEMCLLVFQQVWGPCAFLFLLSSTRLQLLCAAKHMAVLIFLINSFLEQYIQIPQHQFKVLSLLIFDKYRYDISSARYLLKWAWQHIIQFMGLIIYTCTHFFFFVLILTE